MATKTWFMESLAKEDSGLSEMDKKGKREKQIFEKFAEVSPYIINIDSIRKGKPPKPDIFCELMDGTKIAFEMTQCIDSSVAQSINDAVKLHEMFFKELEKLSDGFNNKFMTDYSNAHIQVRYVEGITYRKKVSAIGLIVKHLLAAENKVCNMSKAEVSDDLKNKVLEIHIDKGSFKGPLFDVIIGGSFVNPIIKSLEEKFDKEYNTQYKIDLLLYYDLQPEIPEVFWLSLTEEFIKKHISYSKFQRIWVYSIIKNKIIFFYPALDQIETNK